MRLQKALIAAKRPATQTDAAKQLGVEQPTISGTWNKPGRAPEMDKVLAMALELNVCVEWLYTGRGPMHPAVALDAYGEELLGVWHQLDEKTKWIITGYAVAKASGIEEDASPFVASPLAAPRPT